jgi:hypothetical protein
MTKSGKRAALRHALCANSNGSRGSESPMVLLPGLDDPAIRQRFVRALAELIAETMLRPNGQTK